MKLKWVRNYKKKLGSRNYRTGYPEQSLQSAITEVQQKNVSIRKASKKYKVPFETLQ